MGRVHGTFRRGTWHTERKMKSFTAFLLVGFVTMLWSTSVNGDGNAPNATGVLGYDENYCRGKPDGVFCKADPWGHDRWQIYGPGERPLPEYRHGECCYGRCIEDSSLSLQRPACKSHETCDTLFNDDNDALPENSPCRFKNANNEYEDGICCSSLCSSALSSCNMGRVEWDEMECKGKLEGDKCNFYDLGYDRTYHRIDGKCCDKIKAINGGPPTRLECLRDSDPFDCGF